MFPHIARDEEDLAGSVFQRRMTQLAVALLDTARDDKPGAKLVLDEMEDTTPTARRPAMPSRTSEAPSTRPPAATGSRRRDEHGVRRRKAGFKSKTEARAWFQDVEKKRMRGEAVARPPVTLREHVDRYLEVHAATRDPNTIRVLRERLNVW